MKAGFIGAGKVGFSLGKYLKTGGVELSGYYSLNRESAEEAAVFTGSRCYGRLAALVEDSDTVFITVPDGAIADVWDEMCNLPIKDKNICHCSGSICSTVFFNAEKRGACAYSVHPLYAVSHKKTSYKSLAEAYFVIEGSEKNLQNIRETFEGLGNRVVSITREKKDLYHCAAAVVSNHMVALADMGAEMLTLCGFEREEAEKALGPLIEGNCRKIAEAGPLAALTGPVERGDLNTVERHMNALKPLGKDWVQIYRILSDRLAAIAEKKHTDRDYSAIRERLKEEEM